MSFMIPKLPNPAQPVSPMQSADAARVRQKASDDAIAAASAGGRESTIHAGREIAYAQAGTPILRPKTGASRSMGM